VPPPPLFEVPSLTLLHANVVRFAQLYLAYQVPHASYTDRTTRVAPKKRFIFDSYWKGGEGNCSSPSPRIYAVPTLTYGGGARQRGRLNWSTPYQATHAVHIRCVNASDSFRVGYCGGMVAGVTDASPKVCLGEYVTRGQELRVVAKYL